MHRKISLLLLGISSLLLSACASSANPDSSSEASSSEPASSSSDAGSIVSSSEDVPLNGTFEFYAINDFHGSILERQNGWYYENGLSKIGGLLKGFKEDNPDNTFLIASGDMFQGSLESNYYLGAPIVDCMNEIGFDSMTVGNHEFDYGQEALVNIIDSAEFPVLAGNIMKFENGASTGQRWDKVGISTVIDRGGAKVGIVGMIGEGQTTSITSKYVSDLTFVNPLPLALNEAARLRNVVGCDIVVLSLHDSADVMTVQSNLGDFFDAVFCAHTHDKEREMVDGVPLLQMYCNGEGYSHVTLKAENGVISCTNYENVDASASTEEDPELKAIIDGYLEDNDFVSKSNETLGTLSGGSLNSSGVARLGCKAIYEEYKDYNDDGVVDLACAMENSQRATLSAGSFTYSDLYKCTPFMNSIVILRCTGREIKREAAYNQCYTGDVSTYSSLSDSQYYLIAVIDYLAYHQNEGKSYDYFSSMVNESNIIAEYKTYPVDLTADYVKNECQGQINASDFAERATGFNIYATR